MLEDAINEIYQSSLDRCPFCGGQPTLTSSVEWVPIEKGQNPVRNFKVTKNVYKIVCDCGCEVSSYISRDDVIRIWQSRAGK